MRLSVLICTMTKRKVMFDILKAELNRQKKIFQIDDDTVEILDECDQGQMTIGAKRNLLMSRSTGDYLCFIDDDDSVDGEYLPKILKALEDDPDCVQMIGVMSTDGYNLKRFEHSIAHSAYFDQNGVYYRYPNHLNPIRSEIAMQFSFPELNFGEDTDWATQIRDSGLLQREAAIDRPIYHYLYRTTK